jgi:hypothetical protein
MFLLAAWIAASALLVLPHVTSGTIRTNLPPALTMASIQSPLGALSVWIVKLERGIWRMHVSLRKVLVMTHGLLLLPGMFSDAIEYFALRAFAFFAYSGVIQVIPCCTQVGS